MEESSSSRDFKRLGVWGIERSEQWTNVVLKLRHGLLRRERDRRSRNGRRRPIEDETVWARWGRWFE